MNGNRAASILDYVRGPSVLDIGCAGSSTLRQSDEWLYSQLVARFEKVVGIDRNESAINAMREVGYDQVYVADAATFQCNERFNTVIAGELIEHLESPGAFLRHVKGYLQSSGRLILTTPYPFCLSNIAYAILKFPKTCSNPEHTCWFCPETLFELVERCGFQVREWSLIYDYPSYPSRPSIGYRVIRSLMLRGGWLLPERLRKNAVLIVLERAV